MRDEIKEILTQPLYVTDPDECRQKASGIQLTRILAIFQKRLDEIKGLCRTSGSRLNNFREGHYWEIDDTKRDIDKIYNLCTFDEPESEEPKLAVGQVWEKQPTNRVKIIMMYTNAHGVERVIAENWSGHVDAMSPESFKRYNLVKDGDV